VRRRRDSCDPKNERVRKCLNPKSGRSGVGVKGVGRIGLTKKLVYTPTPKYRVSAGIIGLSRAFVGSRVGRRVERERRPREHGGFSQGIASLLIVFCSTGSILYRKRYGNRSNWGHKEAKAHQAGEAVTRLVAGEVMEVVHDGAAQVAEHEPEHGLENFLGCRRHAGRVSQAGVASRIIVNDAPFLLRTSQKLDSYCTFQSRCGNK
jgi:hypothetical protein